MSSPDSPMLYAPDLIRFSCPSPTPSSPLYHRYLLPNLLHLPAPTPNSDPSDQLTDYVFTFRLPYAAPFQALVYPVNAERPCPLDRRADPIEIPCCLDRITDLLSPLSFLIPGVVIYSAPVEYCTYVSTRKHHRNGRRIAL